MLKGKRVIITGAFGGIGRAICETMVKNGAELFLADRNNQLENEIKSSLLAINKNAKLHFGYYDLSNKEECVALVRQANEEMNGIDVIVGNAGLNLDGLTIRMTDEQWQKVIDIDLTANFILDRECAKIMMKQKYGRIINIASIIGLIGNIGQANYSSAKAGLIAMTKCFAQEFASRGITANCIAPGFIETAMTKAMTDEARKAITDKIPVKRYGTPQDVANSVLFLASELADYITGETISVNGGLVMI